MNENQYDEINKKLDMLIRLSALNLVFDKKQQDQIILLNNAGFQPKDIAEIIETTANTVRVTLSTMRSKKKKGKLNHDTKKEKGNL